MPARVAPSPAEAGSGAHDGMAVADPGGFRSERDEQKYSERTNINRVQWVKSTTILSIDHVELVMHRLLPTSRRSHRRRALAALLRPIGFVSVGALGLPVAYLGVVSAAAVRSERREHRARRSGDAADHGISAAPATRFAVLIPAHDEESVIEATVRALVEQRYANEDFSVHVVADNCTDATADVARRAGADVHERDDPDDPGKGSALNWLYRMVGIDEYDAVVVVDADTIAAPDFLLELHAAFASGADVVQGDYGVLDPARSTAVGLRYAALACRHRLRPLGRRALGCSCGLYGNGMAFRSHVVADRAWSGHLVEDAQFQLDLLLDGLSVTYVPNARVEAEMPATLDAALTQHQRWELGRWQIIKHYLPSLLRSALRPPTPALRRRVYVDAVLDQIVPPLSVVAALSIVSLTTNVGAHALVPHRRTAVSVVLSVAGAACLGMHVVAGLLSADAPRSVWRSLASAPQLIVWKLLLFAGIARRPDGVTWTRTERNDEVHAVGTPIEGAR